MRDYQKSLVYAIRVRGTDNVIYVGSTTDLNKRRYRHKNCCINENSKHYNLDVYRHIRDIGGWETIVFEKIKDYPCDTKQELNKEEGMIIKEYIGAGHQLKNKKIAGRTQKEYQDDNKDEIKERRRIYTKNNKESKKEYDKEYNERNRERIKLRNKKYKAANADKYKAYMKEYTIKNKEKLSKIRKQHYDCPCGGSYTYSSKQRHFKTTKHTKYNESTKKETGSEL